MGGSWVDVRFCLRVEQGRWWGSVSYSFLAKLPVSASMRIPSLTRRFSLARVPSTFFGSSSGPRAWQTSLARIGPVAWLKAARMRG